VCAVLIGVILTVFMIVYCVGTCGGGRRWTKSNVRYIDLERQYNKDQEYQPPLEIVYENYKDLKKKI